MRYTVICNSALNQFFFSTDHCQMVGQESWVPISGELPHAIVPRPGLEDGIVDTIEKYIDIFHSDHELIANPDPSMEPSWAKSFRLQLQQHQLDNFSSMQLVLMRRLHELVNEARLSGFSGFRGEKLTDAEIAEALDWKLKNLGLKR